MSKEKYKNILDIQKADRIELIKKVLNENEFYSDEKANFYLMANMANDFMEAHIVFDKHNPIKNKLGDSVYFEPDSRHIDREGYLIAQIEYALHFITGDNPLKTKRFYDSAKAGVIVYIVDVIANPDKKFFQDANGNIIYLKQIIVGNICCTVLRAEIDSSGALRVITVLPNQRLKDIRKKETSGRWRPDVSSSRYIEKSPPDATQPSTNGDINDTESSSKDNDNSDTKLRKGGKIKNLTKIIEKDGKIVMKYKVDEYASSGTGSATMYDFKGERYEIITWNKKSDEHRAGETTFGVEIYRAENENKNILITFFKDVDWIITGTHA